MPNHVRNCLKFHYYQDSGEKIRAIRAYLAGENGEIDFAKIVPPPEFVKEWVNPLHPEMGYSLSDKEYYWCLEHWGTKWNAYAIHLRTEGEWKLAIDFETAWNWPTPILQKIMADWPDVAVTHIAAIEGCCGAIHQVRDDEGKLTVVEWEYSEANAPIITALHEALNQQY
jgi:hypothetical protein